MKGIVFDLAHNISKSGMLYYKMNLNLNFFNLLVFMCISNWFSSFYQMRFKHEFWCNDKSNVSDIKWYMTHLNYISEDIIIDWSSHSNEKQQ